jgi:hypothetical protein
VASISDLKQRIDLHDLARRLGLVRPGGDHGNYRWPPDGDRNPSLSIFDNGKAFKDFKADVGGDAISFIRHIEGIDDVGEAMRRLHEIYGIPTDKRDAPPPRERTKAEWIAEQCQRETAPTVEYLVGRGVPEETCQRAIKAGALGYNEWTNPQREPGEVGYGGPAAAFLCRDLQTLEVRAIDFRFFDPAKNGNVKTKSTGDKLGVPWYVERRRLEQAHTVYFVESAINALCVEACRFPFTAALALRGTSSWSGTDWNALAGKQVILALDADEPDDKGVRPGAKAAWAIYDELTARNIATLMVDQAQWYAEGFNDVADIAKACGIDGLRERLRDLEPWLIPGLPGKDSPGGRSRVFLPPHDFAVYWRYRCKPDFSAWIAKVETDEDGGEQLKSEDVAGFRVAAVSRVTVQSATATMTGEADAQPTTVFAVSVQTPRHGPQLVRRVLSDDRLHNVDQWKKFGPVFAPVRFARLLNILERTAECGARDAVNFVGLAWRAGKPVLNEGPDCYFSEPEKQCPYHNLVFPSGPVADARRVIAAYQATFGRNAAAQLLTWALAGHLKAFLGFWPHLILQARKGSGKSTLIKRLERTIGMTMFGGASLETAFRVLTSVCHTSHPIGWEEISARKMDVINAAIGTLQESYQHAVTRRGPDLTEFLISAPVLLAGEDVPARSLIGKAVRCELAIKGDLIPETLPRFPVREWLQWLSGLDRERVERLLAAAEASAWQRARAAPAAAANITAAVDPDQPLTETQREQDHGAARMVRNYAAVAAGWALLCEFAGIPVEQGGFLPDLRATMNAHIRDTCGEREPWVWILERAISEIESHQFTHPYTFRVEDGEQCLVIRPAHIMDHLSSTGRLRDEFNALPVKSARVFKRQLEDAGVIAKDGLDLRINSHRHTHLSAISLDRLGQFGVYMSVPDEPETVPAPYYGAANS